MAATGARAASVRIALYSLAYSEGLVRQLPYVEYFPERALCHLGDLRRPEARVVLVTPFPVPDDVLSYHFAHVLGFDAEGERSARRRLVQLSPGVRSEGPLAELLLDDDGLLGSIRQEIAAAGEVVLSTVSASPAVDRLERALGVSADEGPLEAARRWGSKSGGKSLLAAAGAPTYRGRPRALFSVEEVVAEASRLAQSSPPARRVIVKLDDVGWSAGLGNAVVDCQALRDGVPLAAAVEASMQPWDRFEAEIGRSGAIVEEYLPGGSSSPSGQGDIDAAGTVTVRATHEQILHAGHFLGCTYPARSQHREEMARVVGEVGEALAAKDLRGTFGVDFVAYDDGRLVATEVNVRKLGPTHVMAYVESAVDDRLGPAGRLDRSGRALAYVHRRLFEPQSLAGLPVATAVEALDDRGLLWDRAGRSGALLHILGGLATCGYVETTVVAPAPEEAGSLDAEVRAVLLDASSPRRGG